MQHKHFIYADGKLIVLNTQVKDAENKLKDKQVRYLHYDALNSVDMITDGYGLVVERRSYDTWGKQRKVAWREDGPLEVVQQAMTNRGYTGHEEIVEVGLVHMNGRVYDQELGRFISPDPIIQAPYVTNSFNRYAYVMNNPLKYTDPTGYLWDSVKSAARSVGRAISRAARAVRDFVSGGSGSSNSGKRHARPGQRNPLGIGEPGGPEVEGGVVNDSYEGWGRDDKGKWKNRFDESPKEAVSYYKKYKGKSLTDIDFTDEGEVTRLIRYNGLSDTYGRVSDLGQRALQGIGASAQIYSGSALMAGGIAACSTGAGCFAGAPMILGGVILNAHGSNNLLESLTGEVGPIKQLHMNHFGPELGNYTYSVIDIGISVTGYTKLVKNPKKFGLFHHDMIRTGSRFGLTVGLANDYITIDQLIEKENK